MENTQNSSVQPAVTPQANNQPPNRDRVKTYTERFAEMEAQLTVLTQEYVEANQAFSTAASIIQDLASQVRMMNDQLQAIYDLSEAGLTISRAGLTTKINERRVAKVQSLLDQDVKAGALKPVDTVEKDTHIVSYESDGVSLAFKPLQAFDQEGLVAQLKGKKVGDTVGNLTIKGVYEIVDLKPTGDQNNEQKQPQA
jgi:hypothetical protein